MYTEDIPEIENFLLAYLNTPYAERYRFTTRGNKIEHVIKQWYGDSMLEQNSWVRVISRKQIDSHHWKVRATADTAGIEDYYLRLCERSIKFDWEATVGCWSMPVKAYIALGRGQDVVARVSAELA